MFSTSFFNHSTLTFFQRYGLPLFILVALLLMSNIGYAEITAPTLPDGSAASDNFLGDMGKIFKGGFQLGIYALLAAGWLMAGYLIIMGAMNMYNKVGGVGGFFMGIFIAFVMVLSMTYFLDKGETALDDITVSAIFTPQASLSIV